jgi:predicted nucleic acid-binding protein
LFFSRDAFVDTSFWFAALDARDRNHAPAERLAEAANNERVRFHTTREVVSETLTLLRYRTGARASLIFLDDVVPTLHVIDATAELHSIAQAVFRKLAPHRRLSYCDALSFVVVRRILKDAQCLAFDRDFRALGLAVVDWPDT